MRQKQFMYTVVMSLISLNALAGVAGWTDYAPITELTPTTRERFLLTLAVSKNPSGCKTKDVFYQDYDMNGSDKMFYTLLQALISGKRVRVYVTGRCDLKGYSEISSVSLVS